MALSAVILAGGLGSRLGPLTAKTPKVMVEVAGKPFILHQLELLRRNGIPRVTLCVGHLGEMVRRLVGNGSDLGIEVDYSFDGPGLLGTGGAIQNALPTLDDEFFVIYGDSYLDCDYRAIASAFRLTGKSGLMTVLRNLGQWDESNVVFDGRQILVYDKRNRNPNMQFVDYGLGVFKSACFRGFDQSPLDLAEVYNSLLASGDLAAYEVMDRFYEIGSVRGLAETELYLLQKLSL
jgi:MurNAc alpha-1-phosphate uridylyltransferase